MEKIIIDFSGYLAVDKNDLIINEIDKTTGSFKKVDVSKLSSDEILTGYSKGNYYIDLSANHKIAINGEENCFLEKEID